MRIFRISNIFAWSLAILLGSVLFYVSQSVQRAENDLARLKRMAGMELEAIRVLEAEWDYLNSPARLENLAQGYMGSDTIMASQVTSNVENIPEPTVPVIPRIKPARFVTSGSSSSSLSSLSSGDDVRSAVVPAVAASPARSAPIPPTPTSTKHIRQNDREQFKALLQGLNDGGAQ